MIKNNAILVINAGSSSIKFAVFAMNPELEKVNYGIIDKINLTPEIFIYDLNKNIVFQQVLAVTTYEQIILELIENFNNYLNQFNLLAVGHRVVHGGTDYSQPVLIDQHVIHGLIKLIPLAPLHQPYHLKIITALTRQYPNLPQVACFDTAFHASQDLIVRKFAIPKDLFAEGVMRYGFHGISYEYIAKILPSFLPANIANGRVIVAHLGNGSSVCGLKNAKSVASSMGFTALEGLMMGTRCGSIDPGVILYLLEQKQLSVAEVTKLLYSRSGLLGVSGISSDIRELASSVDPAATEALDLFCYRAAREMLALCTVLQGIDAIVFTAGIGENSGLIRSKICMWLKWLGIVLDEEANKHNNTIITRQDSNITIAIIPTNEELMIAQHTSSLVI